MLIGIIGQTGAGKTEVARILKRYGACIISADQIGKEIVEKQPIILKKIVRSFGKGIILSNGRLNRRKLGQVAFSSKKNRKKLNDIVHPPLLRELARQAREMQRKYNWVVIDAALLIDWNWHKKLDYIILVQANDRIKMARLIQKGFTKSEAAMRIKSQRPYRKMRRHADLIIFNNKSIETLKSQVKKSLKSWLEND